MTCQILENKFTHNFVTDPSINIDDLRPNMQTIEKLKEFITTKEQCSIVTDIKLFNTSFTASNDGLYSYTESIALQISSNRNNTNVATIVNDLSICLTKVVDANEINKDVFRNSIKLNVSGELKKSQLVNNAEVDDNFCCHLIYGKPITTKVCCKPGFIENSDNCGKFCTLNSRKIIGAVLPHRIKLNSIYLTYDSSNVVQILKGLARFSRYKI